MMVFVVEGRILHSGSTAKNEGIPKNPRAQAPDHRFVCIDAVPTIESSIKLNLSKPA